MARLCHRKVLLYASPCQSCTACAGPSGGRRPRGFTSRTSLWAYSPPHAYWDLFTGGRITVSSAQCLGSRRGRRYRHASGCHVCYSALHNMAIQSSTCGPMTASATRPCLAESAHWKVLCWGSMCMQISIMLVPLDNRHLAVKMLCMQALKDMDTETLKKILGDVNLPSWVNFPGEPMQGDSAACALVTDTHHGIQKPFCAHQALHSQVDAGRH